MCWGLTAQRSDENESGGDGSSAFDGRVATWLSFGTDLKDVQSKVCCEGLSASWPEIGLDISCHGQGLRCLLPFALVAESIHLLKRCTLMLHLADSSQNHVAGFPVLYISVKIEKAPTSRASETGFVMGVELGEIFLKTEGPTLPHFCIRTCKQQAQPAAVAQNSGARL